MTDPPIDPGEQTLQAEIIRLNKVVKVLIERAEKTMSAGGNDFGVFQTTIMLEAQVRSRTRDLEAALLNNEKINRDLQQEKEEQRKLIMKLEETQTQLFQAEKLASIGQLAAGVAHEINNPISFMNSNLGTMGNYFDRLLRLIDAYEEAVQFNGDPQLLKRIDEIKKSINIKRIRDDIDNLVKESIDGTERVRRIVKALRDFSHVGEVEWQPTDLHDGLNSTLDLVWSEIQSKAEVIKEFGSVPFVECIPSQINQVFMNLILNAAQFIPEHGTIILRTGTEDEDAWISVSDTGVGIPLENLSKIFDPFFTTKPLGQGTGLGLAIAYGIIKTHNGSIKVDSESGQGTTFTIRLPIHRKTE
ncbi:MAG: ATP-binding protein [Treponemataceae bacterium]